MILRIENETTHKIGNLYASMGLHNNISLVYMLGHMDVHPSGLVLIHLPTGAIVAVEKTPPKNYGEVTQKEFESLTSHHGDLKYLGRLVIDKTVHEIPLKKPEDIKGIPKVEGQPIQVGEVIWFKDPSTLDHWIQGCVQDFEFRDLEGIKGWYLKFVLRGLPLYVLADQCFFTKAAAKDSRCLIEGQPVKAGDLVYTSTKFQWEQRRIFRTIKIDGKWWLEFHKPVGGEFRAKASECYLSLEHALGNIPT